MARVFPFTTMLRKNMIDKEKPDLYYAIAKPSGDTDVDELAERIQRASTVNWADVLCVLRALQTEMIDSFKRGETVRLGDLGSFYITLRSTGTALQEDVKSNLILGARVRFRPGKELLNTVRTLTYGKYKTDKKDDEDTPDPDDPNPDEGGDGGGGQAPDPTA